MKEETFLIFLLLFMLTTFVISAAFLFQHFEYENEGKHIAAYEELLSLLQKENNISDDVMAKLLNAQEYSCRFGVRGAYNRKWDYPGSIYYAWTILTTIGFGHTIPTSTGGQVWTIFFALTSIPLYVLLMNILLEKSITVVKKFLNKIQQLFPAYSMAQKQQDSNLIPVGKILIVTVILFLLSIVLLAFIFASLEDWTFFEAVYFLVITVTTVGFGDFVPSKHATQYNTHAAYRILSLLVIFLAVVLAYVVLNLTASIWKNILVNLNEGLSKCIPCLEFSKDVRDTNSIKRKRSSRSNSTFSFVDDGLGFGSFAAIQKAIDRIRMKQEAEECDEMTSYDNLKAIDTIEAILKREYKKVQMRQGNDTPSKWRRAAAKARIDYRRQHSSNMYKSVIEADGKPFRSPCDMNTKDNNVNEALPYDSPFVLKSQIKSHVIEVNEYSDDMQNLSTSSNVSSFSVNKSCLLEDLENNAKIASSVYNSAPRQDTSTPVNHKADEQRTGVVPSTTSNKKNPSKDVTNGSDTKGNDKSFNYSHEEQEFKYQNKFRENSSLPEQNPRQKPTKPVYKKKSKSTLDSSKIVNETMHRSYVRNENQTNKIDEKEQSSAMIVLKKLRTIHLSSSSQKSSFF